MQAAMFCTRSLDRNNTSVVSRLPVAGHLRLVRIPLESQLRRGLQRAEVFVLRVQPDELVQSAHHRGYEEEELVWSEHALPVEVEDSEEELRLVVPRGVG